MKLPVYNQSGEKISEMDLNSAVFEVKTKKWIIHEAVVAQNANARVNIAHTKDRSEVRGGGRKPWKQKGTGRARHGSSRSPLWRGGGITFGPRNTTNFKKKINVKVKRQALVMSLSEKAKNQEIVILDKLELTSAKTKQVTALLKNLNIANKKLLISLDEQDNNLRLSANNIPEIKLIGADSLNVIDVLWADSILTTSPGIKKMETTYGNNQ